MRSRRPAALAVLITLAVALSAVLALAATGLLGGGQGDGPSPQEQARLAADEFLDTYLDPQGRVVRRDQAGDTVSEGQAYAMLLAVAIEDPDRFARAWRWAQDNLMQSDGLLAFRWADGAVVDANAATDAELDAIRALVLAAERFDEPGYRRDAERLAQAVERHLVSDEAEQPVLLPGVWADDDADTVINPSYYAPRSFAHLDELRPTGLWTAVEDTSRQLVDDLTDSAQLPPDWAHLADGGVRPVAGPGDNDGDPRYSYDAVRLPVRYAESCHDEDRALAARLWPLLDGNPTASVRSLDGADLAQERHASAVVGAAAAASASGDAERAGELLDRAAALDDERPSYYGSAWVALGRVVLDTELLGGC